jgi:hypothetical protein
MLILASASLIPTVLPYRDDRLAQELESRRAEAHGQKLTADLKADPSLAGEASFDRKNFPGGDHNSVGGEPDRRRTARRSDGGAEPVPCRTHPAAQSAASAATGSGRRHGLRNRVARIRGVAVPKPLKRVDDASLPEYVGFWAADSAHCAGRSTPAGVA